jgi:hypothetical protein
MVPRTKRPPNEPEKHLSKHPEMAACKRLFSIGIVLADGPNTIEFDGSI